MLLSRCLQKTLQKFCSSHFLTEQNVGFKASSSVARQHVTNISASNNSSYEAANNKNSLKRFFIDKIRLSGPISKAEYMQICAGSPPAGYYPKNEGKIFGARGDFLTSPEFMQIIPLQAPLHPSMNIDISDPFRDKSLVGFVLDLPRSKTSPIMDDHPGQNNYIHSIIMPSNSPTAPKMYTGGGWPLIRRRKRLKKHWYKKHFKRDLAIHKSRKIRRKAAKEKIFRDKLTIMIKEAQNFGAKEYVEEFLAKIEWDETKPLPDSSLLINTVDENYPSAEKSEVTKKEFIHWTNLISVEQLYGLPHSDKIDKKAGIVDDEEWREILESRKKYQKEIASKRCGPSEEKDAFKCDKSD